MILSGLTWIFSLELQNRVLGLSLLISIVYIPIFALFMSVLGVSPMKMAVDALASKILWLFRRFLSLVYVFSTSPDTIIASKYFFKSNFSNSSQAASEMERFKTILILYLPRNLCGVSTASLFRSTWCMNSSAKARVPPCTAGLETSKS